MSRITKLVLLMLISGSTFAQDSLWNNFPEFYKHPFRTVMNTSQINFWAEGQMNSSSASNDLLYRLYFKNSLDNQVIRNSAERALLKNTVGSENNIGIEYINMSRPLFKKDSLYWTVRYNFRDHVGFNYSDVLFRLIGLGNKEFEGDTAKAGGFEAMRNRFDAIEFGIYKIFPNRSNLSVSLGPARGMQYINVEGRQLQVYTAEYGTHMDWEVDIEAGLTPGLESTPQYVHGMGLTLSAEYNGLLNPNGAYSVGFQNFGFMTYDHVQFSKKDSFQYNGWYIPSWQDLTREGAGGDAYDSIVEIFRPQIDSNARSTQLLPTYVYVEYTMKLGNRSALAFKFDKVMFTPMLPRFTVGYTYFAKNLYSTTNMAFGGYGRFNLNQRLGYRLKQHQLGLQLYGLEAMVMPKQASGFGAGLSYTYSFGS